MEKNKEQTWKQISEKVKKMSEIEFLDRMLNLFLTLSNKSIVTKEELDEIEIFDYIVIEEMEKLGILTRDTENNQENINYRYSSSPYLYELIKKDIKEKNYKVAIKHLTELFKNDDYPDYLNDANILTELIKHFYNNKVISFAILLCENYCNSSNEYIKQLAKEYLQILECNSKILQELFEKTTPDDNCFNNSFLETLIQNGFHLLANELSQTYIESENETIRNDALYYLYLLSFLIDLPKDLKEKVKQIEPEEIWRYKNPNQCSTESYHNKSRAMALKNSFPYAVSNINLSDLCSNFEKRLLIAVSEKEKNKKDTLLQYIKTGNYDEAQEYIRQREKQHKISKEEKYIQIILENLKTKKNSFQKRKNDKYQTIFQAIENDDYAAALQLSSKYWRNIAHYLKENNKQKNGANRMNVEEEFYQELLNQSLMYILLSKIVEDLDIQDKNTRSKSLVLQPEKNQ